MAITQVGATVSDALGSGADVTLTLPSMLAGDVVVLIGGTSNATSGPLPSTAGPSTAGYTQIILDHTDSDTGTPSEDWCMFGAWYKVMGATPDTSVVGQGNGNASNATVYHAIVLRGVDTTTPVEAVSTMSRPGDSNPPNPPAVTVATVGAWVFACGAIPNLDATATAPTGYTGLAWAAGNDTNDISAGFAYKEATATGTEDPGAFSGLDAPIELNPGAFTFAIKPAGGGLTQVTSSRSTTWDVKASATSSRATTWTTSAAVASTRASLWDVLAAVTPSTRATSWTAHLTVSSTRATTWNVDGTLASVTSTRSTTWQARATATSSRATTWQVAAATTSTRATTWATTAAVTSPRATTWNVSGSLTTITSTRETSWTVRATTTSNRATTWTVHATTTVTRATTWTVRTPVATSTRSTTWTVTNTVTAQRATLWSLRQLVTATRSTTWNVYSDALPPRLSVGPIVPPRYSTTPGTGSRYTAAAIPARYTIGDPP